jgi:O-methyltransferase
MAPKVISFKSVLRSIIRTFGIDIIRFPQKEAEPEDLPPEFRKAVSVARPHSLTTNHRLASTVDAVRYVTANSIPGAIVECGVWRGGNMVAAAVSLLAMEDLSRELFLYDTYEGMCAPTNSDKDYQPDSNRIPTSQNSFHQGNGGRNHSESSAPRSCRTTT